MKNTYVTWDCFHQYFGAQMDSAEDVYNNMVRNGLIDNCLIEMDFSFFSNEQIKLEELSMFLKEHYPYSIGQVELQEDEWVLKGLSKEIPITAENLLYWALDLYKRGYEFDSDLRDYGGAFDPKNQQKPTIDASMDDFYFDAGFACYEKGDLSGAMINWSLSIACQPDNPDSFYCRAIAKSEIHIWKSALRDYDQAIRLVPNFTDAIINRGSLKDDNGDFHGAIEDYNKALSIGNLAIEAEKMIYFNRGNSKFNLRNKRGACEDWHKAYDLGYDLAKEKIENHCR